MGGTEADGPAVLLDDRYRLGESIGEGGMARVYRAEDVKLGRTVALKLIRPGVDGAQSDRARSEMTVLASLNHPSLVTLFDARLVPGQPEYLVMEFVDGPTLSARLASGALAPATVAHFAAELAEALHVVHAAGIVHRDIKPSNVLLSPAHLPGSRPRAKLADFGIAYLLDASRLTSPGMVVGTVAYLAPEQIRGDAPSPASDIYSLGLVLLECLTGRRDQAPGGGMAAALARLETPPTIPDSLDPSWRALLAGMLALEKSERPTAAEVASSAAALSDGTVSDPGPPQQTAVTIPFTGPTLIAPAGGLVAAGHASAVPSAAPGASASRTDGNRRRRRMLALVGGALAAVAVAVAAVFGFSLLGAPDVTPTPGPTVPADPEPSEAPPVDDDDGEDGGGGPGMTEEERKAAEEARKEAEEELKKLEEQQKKQEQKEEKERKSQGDD